MTKRFQADYEYFKSRGIVIYPKIFTGPFNILTGKIIPKNARKNQKRCSNKNLGKLRKKIHHIKNQAYKNVRACFHERILDKYPDSYTEEEREIIIEYNPNLVRRIPFYSKGMKCNAGIISLVIKPEGNIQRCIVGNKKIGSVYTGVKLLTTEEPCTVTSCSAFMGIDNKIPELKPRMRKEWAKLLNPNLSL